MADRIVFLDLSKVNLFGWEGRIGKQKLESIIKGIEAGDNLPAVPVIKINDATYQLTELHDERGKIGGHTRSYAHYSLKKPMKCEIKGEQDYVDFDEFGEINIRELKVDDSKFMNEHFERLRQTDRKYR
jgi:hypothetical protein